jgi:hypothetical protein
MKANEIFDHFLSICSVWTFFKLKIQFCSLSPFQKVFESQPCHLRVAYMSHPWVAHMSHGWNLACFSLLNQVLCVKLMSNHESKDGKWNLWSFFIYLFCFNLFLSSKFVFFIVPFSARFWKCQPCH